MLRAIMDQRACDLVGGQASTCAERDQIVRGIAAKYRAGMRTTDAARWIVGQAFIYETGEYRFH
jgi:hypothetical protein